MSTYYLRVLNSTSVDSMSCREQHFTKTVEADGWNISGEGRVYIFWKQPGESMNDRKTVACYPTNCTIIERIT